VTRGKIIKSPALNQARSRLMWRNGNTSGEIHDIQAAFFEETYIGGNIQKEKAAESLRWRIFVFVDSP
jgi:hypothetical protein